MTKCSFLIGSALRRLADTGRGALRSVQACERSTLLLHSCSPTMESYFVDLVVLDYLK